MAKATPSIEFNDERILNMTAKEFGALAGGTDVRTIANFFSEAISECPAEWGEPTNPDTWLDMPYGAFGTKPGERKPGTLAWVIEQAANHMGEFQSD